MKSTTLLAIAFCVLSLIVAGLFIGHFDQAAELSRLRAMVDSVERAVVPERLR